MRQAPNRRSERTRAGLLAAFSGLVFAKRYENVSIREVVAAAGVARSTFYEHFTGKEDLLRASMTPLFAVIADCVVTDEQPADLLKVVDHLWSNRRLTDAIFSGHARNLLARNQADLVEHRLRSMAVPLHLPSRLAAVQIGEAQLSLVEGWLRGRAGCDPATLAGGLHRTSRAAALALVADEPD